MTLIFLDIPRRRVRCLTAKNITIPDSTQLSALHNETRYGAVSSVTRSYRHTVFINVVVELSFVTNRLCFPNPSMPTDLDIQALIVQGNSFVRVNSIAWDAPILEIVTNCHEWERMGIPFVIRGISLDSGSETPFDGSTEWLKTLLTGSYPPLPNLS